LAKGRLPSVVSRARKIAGKGFARDFGERFLRGVGLNPDDFRSGGFVKGRLGLFGESITKSIPGQAGPGPQPTIEQPQRVANENNPSITTIIKQLDTLVKTAKKVGILSKEQQDALLGQIAQARRLSKEQILENKQPPIPVPTAAGSAAALTPLGDMMDDLRQQIDKLTGKVAEKNQEQDSNNRGFTERFFDAYGFGDDYRQRRRRGRARAARAMRTAPPTSFTVRGQQLELNKSGRWVDAATKRYASREVAEIATRRSQRAAASAVRATTTSSGIARAIGMGATRSTALARTAGSNVKSVVRRVAAPIVAKGLGTTALKSIPIIGGIAAAGFAVDRLVKGDVLGAGLDLMSGLGGPLTAIPALIASTARDVYSSVYGVQPENDLAFAKRIPEVTGAVESLVKEQISGSVDVKSKPTQEKIDQKIVPPVPPQAPERMSAPSLGTPLTPPSITRPGTPGTSSSAGAAASADAASPETSAAATPASAETSTPAAIPSPTAPTTGTDILTATTPPVPPVQVPSLYGFNQELGRFLPQVSSTSKNGHVGIGVVPDPDYIPSGYNNLPVLYNVMFFNVNYQEQ